MKSFKKIRLIMAIIIILTAITGCNNLSVEKFDSLTKAETKIGKIKTPEMLNLLEVSKIEYFNDDFTTPVIKVYYNTQSNEEIIFMITSSLYDDKEFEAVESNKIKDLKWIKDGENYILKWRKSDQESYKYLITRNQENRNWLIEVAENN